MIGFQSLEVSYADATNAHIPLNSIYDALGLEQAVIKQAGPTLNSGWALLQYGPQAAATALQGRGGIARY